MRRTRPSLVLLWIAAALSVGQAVALVTWYWPGAMPDTNTSGVWIALADDFAHGALYRPLQGALGFGGTRYMPLFIVLHGLLMKAGIGALPAGVILTLTSAGLMVTALGFLLRTLGIPRSIAWPAAVLLLGLVSVEMLLLTVRGDFLAVAFDLFGVAAAVRWSRRGGLAWLAATAAAFAGAFLTKLTTVFGLAAAAAWSWRGGRRGRAAALAGLSAGLMLAGTLLAVLASDGRMIASFRAVADGGIGWATAAELPLRILDAFGGDPLLWILVVPALIAWQRILRDDPAGLPALLLAGTTAVTLFIFASPGTASNHLFDLDALAILGISLAYVRHPRLRGWLGTGFGVFALGIAISWLPGVPSIRAFFGRFHRPEVASVQDHFSRGGPRAHPVLATNPLIPILAGERPFVADAFNFRIMLERDPVLHAEFCGQVRAGRFGSVVLSNWPGIFPRDVESPDDPLIGQCLPAFIELGTLGEGFTPALLERYRIVRVHRPYIYFMRREDPPDAGT